MWQRIDEDIAAGTSQDADTHEVEGGGEGGREAEEVRWNCI